MKIIDTIIVLVSFAVITAGALIVAELISPNCLSPADYEYSDEAVADCRMVKIVNPDLRRKTRVYLEQIEGMR